VSASTTLRPPPGRLSINAGPVLFAFGLGAALAIGLAVGSPTADHKVLALGFLGVVIVSCALLWPQWALRVMLASIVLQVVWIVVDNRAINAVDVLLIPMLLVALLGGTRRRALAEDFAYSHPDHLAILGATGRLRRWVIAFYALIAISLVALAARGHPAWAFDSSLYFARALQGLAFFPLCLWWLRSQDEFRGALRAIQVGAWLLVVVNLWFLATAGIKRAGMTWVVNDRDWPITSPNETAVTLLFVIALIQSRPKAWRGVSHYLLVGAMVAMLVLTQSRSGLLAFLVYAATSFRWRWSAVARIAILAAIALPLVPAYYWERMARTLSPQTSSFETFGAFIRFYGWMTAWKVFQTHPIFGVGYLGFRFISSHYNAYRLVLGAGTESYFFEIAVSMGIIGVIAL
jgi:O-antigen ligase